MNDIELIRQKIYEIRGQRVMLDFDLAAIYGVETRRLNEQVKRNIERFPEDFMFQLTKSEFEILKSQIVISNLTENQTNDILISQNATSSWGGTCKLPYAFTENGVAMLSSVLRSPSKLLLQNCNRKIHLRNRANESDLYKKKHNSITHNL